MRAHLLQDSRRSPHWARDANTCPIFPSTYSPCINGPPRFTLWVVRPIFNWWRLGLPLWFTRQSATEPTAAGLSTKDREKSKPHCNIRISAEDRIKLDGQGQAGSICIRKMMQGGEVPESLQNYESQFQMSAKACWIHRQIRINGVHPIIKRENVHTSQCNVRHTKSRYEMHTLISRYCACPHTHTRSAHSNIISISSGSSCFTWLSTICDIESLPPFRIEINLFF